MPNWEETSEVSGRNQTAAGKRSRCKIEKIKGEENEAWGRRKRRARESQKSAPYYDGHSGRQGCKLDVTHGM